MAHYKKDALLCYFLEGYFCSSDCLWEKHGQNVTITNEMIITKDSLIDDYFERGDIITCNQCGRAITEV